MNRPDQVIALADMADRSDAPFDTAYLESLVCAALTGITANPHFFGSLYQQDPEGAADFAWRAAVAAMNYRLHLAEEMQERSDRHFAEMRS